jgi:(p)ppGpp synthase/HD superfamily hydrolase
LALADIVEAARLFATEAHRGQKRKYNNLDYITHPEAVVAILRDAGITDEATLVAAMLHDTIEDTDVTSLALYNGFGADVACTVLWLTDCGLEVGNRETRKARDRYRLSCAPAAAQTIKVADLIDNTCSIVERDPDFAVTYMREKALLLPLLTKADDGLRRRAAELLAAYEGRPA